MKPNPETTKTDRLRTVVGTLLAAMGVFTLVILGAFYGYANATIWIVGLLLLMSGLLIAGSMQLAIFIQNITRL